MSTLRVSSINNAAASAGGITIDSSGGVSGALPAPNRNLLYNGAMQVSQRGTSVTGITTGGYRTADRWNSDIVSIGTWTQDIQNDAPTGSGFRRSLRMLCTTADAAPAASDNLWIVQSLEGQDVQRIRKGTSSAQKLTLSFWVKTNVTGTYVAFLFDNDNTRSVSASYSIAAGDSGNWVKRTITFPADTTGALDNDNGDSLRVYFALAAGSNFTSGTLATTWSAYSAANLAVGQVNVAAAINNYWQVTGVQLEVGDAATDFEFKSYGQELRECQRYYFRVTSDAGFSDFGAGFNSTTTVSSGFVTFPVSMRTRPTALEQSGTASNYAILHGSTRTQCSAVPTYSTSTVNGSRVAFTVASGLTAGQGCLIGADNVATAYLAWSAEL